MTDYLSSRRTFIVFGFIICVLLALPSFAQSSRQIARAQAIANHFSEIKTMTGDFIQFSPKGKMSEGTFYLERPGKIRFGYKGVPLQIIADGRTVGVNNRALNTWNLYQLSQTPMKFLLDDKINISSENLLALREDPGVITIVLHDKSIGKGQIRMIFDSKTYNLRQWTIVDQQNLETTVQIINVRTGIRFADGMFTIPYKNIAISRNRNGN
ncbi:LolA family protein [Bartonella sp. WD16.2]|uniref:LolA family protein n=1 Tax=Bartonella sp. WD16.2 TaxID=1933904 RepID=UPI0009996065|nr:outer membrane lipoprotein carrier protein LolA [Bartonella sp. WD16.2]AQX20472.1 Outer membrane lipoprotein-sorting protein [Bartonella sp. WD16.2]